jgi:PRTRC genetic system protein B
MLSTTVSKRKVELATRQNSVEQNTALVLHSVKTGNQTQQVITKHNIVNGHLEEGKVINSKQVKRMINSKEDFFDRSEKIKPLVSSVIDERVIAENETDVVFYTPPSQRTLWYSTTQNTNFSILSPGLLFHFNKNKKSVRVFCYLNRKKPKLDTMLYLPPMLNIDQNGSLCTGTMRLPKTWSNAGIDLIVSNFFDSRFTHSNMKSAGGLPEIYTNDHANMTFMAALEQSKRKMKAAELVEVKTISAYLENADD